MNPADFANTYGSLADIAAAQTGVPAATILAQWADETGYGTSSAFTDGHNFAGVSPGGSVGSYPDWASGLKAYIDTLNMPIYNAARVSDPTAAAVALGQSPWAESHYATTNGSAGSDLVAIVNTIEGSGTSGVATVGSLAPGRAATSGVPSAGDCSAHLGVLLVELSVELSVELPGMRPTVKRRR